MERMKRLYPPKMNIHFILVEPALPENVGASARAIKTMGFRSLWLVNPCNHLDDKAKWLAHGSVDIQPDSNINNRIMERLGALGDGDIHLLHSLCHKLSQQLGENSML